MTYISRHILYFIFSNIEVIEIHQIIFILHITNNIYIERYRQLKMAQITEVEIKKEMDHQ